MEEIEHQRYMALNKELYPKRKQTIERIFIDAKEKHGMRWMKWRRLKKVATHTMLTFAAMNLKKLAAWLWKGEVLLFFYSKFQCYKKGGFKPQKIIETSVVYNGKDCSGSIARKKRTEKLT